MLGYLLRVFIFMYMGIFVVKVVYISEFFLKVPRFISNEVGYPLS